jgi:hypothetical protein
MARIAVLVVFLTVAVAACGGDEGELRTDVVHWSPLTQDRTVKSSLDIQKLGNGECIGRSLTIGHLGYRCKAGRWVLDPCWRSGDGVACVGFPWDDSVSTIRVRGSWFDDHPTARNSSARPWAIELADGHRCRILQSSHVTVRLRGRPLAVQYDCDAGLVLLRNLTRGRVWKVATARWDHGRYAVTAGAAVQRAYFG